LGPDKISNIASVVFRDCSRLESASSRRGLNNLLEIVPVLFDRVKQTIWVVVVQPH
jgi:hypothetical protein